MENKLGMNLIPLNEEERLENLKKYNILYTQSEPVFDQIAAGVATAFDMPIALINFVDKDNVWTKADQEAKGGGKWERGSSLCSLAILKDSVTVIEDTLTEPMLLSNPWMAAEHGLRFYAAAPIKTSENFNLGVVCIMDKVARKFTPEDQDKLESIARLITLEIEKRVK